MIKVLDCTLRDGGYINQWAYGEDVARGIMTGVAASGVEYIEIGFLCNTKDDESTTIYTTVAEAEALLPKECESQTVLLMIEFGQYDIERVPDRSTCAIDGIRLIFKKSEIAEALEYAGQLKQKGYKVFFNPISVTSYTDTEMLDLISKVNTLEPYAFSIVDTYGLMHQELALHYFHLIDDNLGDGITIGAHFHNHLQMAYANCIALIKTDRKHELVIDSACYGMGKRAGNACTELLCNYLNKREGKHYDIVEIIKIIEAYMLDIQRSTPWGYNVRYYIGAQANVHPNYVSYLEKKHTFSTREELDILNRIPEEYKLSYSEAIIENLCSAYEKTR